MKSRPRFCDRNVLRKDITRFAPVWAIYLIGGLLVTISALAESYTPQETFWGCVKLLNGVVGIFSMINIIYAMVVAQVLFGDLFNGRLCNALHAMPLRRETWYMSHLLSGLLFSLVPNLIGALSFIPFLGPFWYTAFLWLGGMMLHYLLFFGLAVLSMESTGNRFAAVVVYGILNFGALLVLYLLQNIYVPLLYGVELDLEALYRFSPVVALAGSDYYFQGYHPDSCPCGQGQNSDGYGMHCKLNNYAISVSDDWNYLILTAVVGLAALVLGALLYRRRRLESAGDFVAFKPMKPIFRIIFTIATTGFCHFVADWVFGLWEFGAMIFALVGLIVGYFVSHMFVERTVKVFKKRNFLGLLLITLAVLASLLLTAWDVLGISRTVPQESQVETVYIVDSKRFTSPEELDRAWRYNQFFQSSDPAEIRKAISLHQAVLEEGEAANGGVYVKFVYKMKDGRTLIRCYLVRSSTQAFQTFQDMLCNPRTLFAADSLEAFQAQLKSIICEEKYTGQEARELAQALWADMEAGYLNVNLYDKGDRLYLELNMQRPGERDTINRTLWISKECKNTIAWLYAHGY